MIDLPVGPRSRGFWALKFSFDSHWALVRSDEGFEGNLLFRIITHGIRSWVTRIPRLTTGFGIQRQPSSP